MSRSGHAPSSYDDLDELMARMDSRFEDQIAPLSPTTRTPSRESRPSTSSSRVSSRSRPTLQSEEGHTPIVRQHRQQRDLSLKSFDSSRSHISSRSLPPSPSQLNYPSSFDVRPPVRSISSQKLYPRSPRNERVDHQDFDFLKGSARLAKLSSTRSARLKQDLEQVASQIRRQTSESSLPSSPSVPRFVDEPPIANDDDDTARLRPNGLAISGAQVSPRLGSPMPSPGLPSSSSKHLAPPQDKDDVKSLSSASMHSIGSAGATWTAAAAALRLHGSPSHFSPGKLSSKSPRTRDDVQKIDSPHVREPHEWSQACFVWQRDTAKLPSSASGSVRMPPLIRDVPLVMKRRMGKRDSSNNLASIESASPLDDDRPRSHGLFSSSSKARVTVVRGPSATQRDGTWRPMTSVLREDGYLRLFNEDKVLVQSVHLPSCLRTDIRLADPSLFGTAHVVALHRRSSNPPLTPGVSSHSSTSNIASDEPIYLRMPSSVATETWLVMALCHARPEFFVTSHTGVPHFDTPDLETLIEAEDAADSPNDRCRVFRRVTVSIIEGRAIGESHVDSPVKDRRFDEAFSPTTSFDTQSVNSASERPARRVEVNDHHGASSSSKSSSIDSFAELVLDGVVVARTAVRKQTSSPIWNETFTLSDLPPITNPLVINVYAVKSSKVSLLGSASMRVPDMPRGVVHDDWYAIRGFSSGSDFVGDVSTSIVVEEEAILPSTAYSPMLSLLLNDAEADLALDLAQDFTTSLEDIVHPLLRIYFASSVLLARLFRLVEVEIADNALDSSATLFRGNSILTKSVELYLRLVGADYLEASLGDVVRRLCADKVDIEIDPSKMKANVKDKVVEKSVHELQTWTFDIWRSIYDARHKCPNDIRLIFQKIQQVVGERWQDEHKRLKSTAVSAFAFLRFFVPAILNPKLFGLVSSAPDPKSQRALTLIAKSLQGLANFATFGQKEPWMYHMNDFVQDNTSAFVDFIDYISTPSSAAKNEWTDANAAVYMSAQRLTESLPSAAREGIPSLPHLVDLPRCLGQLAARVARKEPSIDRSPISPLDSRSDSPASSSRRAMSSSYLDFRQACVDVHEETQRKGAGLLSATASGSSRSLVKTSFLSRARVPSVALPTAPKKRSSLVDYTAMLPSTGSMHDVRNHAVSRPSTESTGASDTIANDKAVSSTTTKRNAHRNFTVNGLSPTRDGGVRPNFVGMGNRTTDDFEASLGITTPEPFNLRPPTDIAINDDEATRLFPAGRRERSKTPNLRRAASSLTASGGEGSDTTNSGSLRARSSVDPLDSGGASTTTTPYDLASGVGPKGASSTSSFFGIPRSVSMMPSKSTGSASIASSASSLSIVADALMNGLDRRRKSSTTTTTVNDISEAREEEAGATLVNSDDRPRRRSLWRMTGSSSRSKHA